MTTALKWHDRWLARLPANRLLTRLLLEGFQEHRWKYLAASGAMILVAVATACSAWMMGQIVDALAVPENRTQVVTVGVGVATVFMFRGFAMYGQAVLMARAGNRIVAQKQMLMYDRMLRQGVAFFNSNASSELLLKITQSAQSARAIIDTIVSGFIRDLLTLVGLVAVMFYQQPVLSLVSLVVAPIVVYGIQRILRLVRSVMEQEMAGLGEIIRVVQETALGARVVKAFGLEPRMFDRMHIAVRQVEDRNNRIVQLQSATMPLLDIVAGLAIASIVVLSTVDVFGRSPGTPGQLMSFVTAFLMSYEPAARLSKMRVVIESNMVGVRLMYDLLDEPQSMLEKPNAVPLKPGPGSVELDNASFAYGEGDTVLKSVNVAFQPGKTTALVGPSGGGKSTLLNLILRLYDPVEGEVRIDGQDIRNATFSSLRGSIAFVGQETFLFNGTVMDNLLMARDDATEEDAVAAAKVANAHDFIEKLPQGYGTIIGENGSTLSGGQRQRLSIARAVLRQAPILLLDEATSALDSHSEALVRDALETITRGVTTIVIAHRLSTVMNADEICYLEAGEIVEQGSISALLAANGKFRALYDMQSGNRSMDQ
ncbi:ABC transporter ATP-binding protein [Cognatiyoonia sp. IB215182]|uniref:ABC transporter ATP-binding protein n=1 Tax=Cognatiyoonia sp. IB215182 TaxID=3097353 RepID=UPI002A0D2859|nr:ABC transporter ATP-binding protein [Cognatiyoonia sp. IB215182]MDX8354710.1 ABC transporter ATP-binding protein [Cognatiyoonia sp. IB215182]